MILSERILELSGQAPLKENMNVVDEKNKQLDAFSPNNTKSLSNIREFGSHQVKDINKAYDMFTKTYKKLGGTGAIGGGEEGLVKTSQNLPSVGGQDVWSFEKFKQRFSNWTFMGDEKGWVAYRKQRSGLIKLTGAAGNPRSIIAGFAKLMKTGLPIWGMVNENIRNMAERVGFKSPSTKINKMIFQMISDYVFGNEKYTINPDGSVTFDYSDIGKKVKYFIGNQQYFEWLVNQATKMIPHADKKQFIDLLKKEQILIGR